MSGPTVISTLILCLFVQDAPTAPRVPSAVDLQQIGGTYYEIARIPNRLQDVCAGDVTTTYAATPDGQLDVMNRCRKDDGTMAQVHGVGRKTGDGRVQVRFAAQRRLFGRRTWEDYSMLATGPEYNYLVIGNESRTCLWILSRMPRMSPLSHRQALEIAEANGYDVATLVPTRQSE
jgi:apolipoprotein D and lipocalin family protein